MTQGARTARVAEEFREVLAEEIQKLKDPRIGFVTVTGVQVTADLRRAWVSYTVLGTTSSSVRRPRGCGRRRRTSARRSASRSGCGTCRSSSSRWTRRSRSTSTSRRSSRACIAEGASRMPEASEQEALRRAAEVLSAAEEVALACHLNPDADALGSMLGLSNFLRARGVATVCSFANEPFDLPRWIIAAAGGRSPRASDARSRAEPAVMVTCDCASFDRLGVLGQAASRAGELIWIDHHRSNDGVGTVRLVDPDASSTCEMVFRLIETMGGDFDRGRRRLSLRGPGHGHRAIPVPGDHPGDAPDRRAAPRARLRPRRARPRDVRGQRPGLPPLARDGARPHDRGARGERGLDLPHAGGPRRRRRRGRARPTT